MKLNRKFTALRLSLLLAILCVVLFTQAAVAAEFSADLVRVAGKTTTTGKVFVKNDKIREEATTKGETSITILRLDLSLAWNLLPPDSYMEIPLPVTQMAENPPKEYDSDKISLGTEVVSGYTCEKVQMVFKNKKLGSVTQWISSDLGVALRIETRDGKGKLQSTDEYKNVVLGAQDDSLFELPAGYKKFELPFGLKLPGMK
jgi:outer membrane lipoprotein-sorting protein